MALYILKLLILMEIIHYRLFHKIDIEKVPRKEKGLKTTSELCFKQMTKHRESLLLFG